MSQAGATRSIADLPGPPGFPSLGNAIGCAGSLAFGVGGVVRAVRADVPFRSRPAADRRGRRAGGDQHDSAGTSRGVSPLADREGDSRRVGQFDGVFSARGRIGERQRRLAVMALNSNHLHRYFHVIHTAHRAAPSQADAGRTGGARRSTSPTSSLVQRGRHIGAFVRS